MAPRKHKISNIRNAMTRKTPEEEDPLNKVYVGLDGLRDIQNDVNDRRQQFGFLFIEDPKSFKPYFVNNRVAISSTAGLILRDQATADEDDESTYDPLIYCWAQRQGGVENEYKYLKRMRKMQSTGDNNQNGHENQHVSEDDDNIFHLLRQILRLNLNVINVMAFDMDLAGNNSMVKIVRTNILANDLHRPYCPLFRICIPEVEKKVLRVPFARDQLVRITRGDTDETMMQMVETFTAEKQHVFQLEEFETRDVQGQVIVSVNRLFELAHLIDDLPNTRHVVPSVYFPHVFNVSEQECSIVRETRIVISLTDQEYELTRAFVRVGLEEYEKRQVNPHDYLPDNVLFVTAAFSAVNTSRTFQVNETSMRSHLDAQDKRNNPTYERDVRTESSTYERIVFNERALWMLSRTPLDRRESCPALLYALPPSGWFGKETSDYSQPFESQIRDISMLDVKPEAPLWIHVIHRDGVNCASVYAVCGHVHKRVLHLTPIVLHVGGAQFDVVYFRDDQKAQLENDLKARKVGVIEDRPLPDPPGMGRLRFTIPVEPGEDPLLTVYDIFGDNILELPLPDGGHRTYYRIVDGHFEAWKPEDFASGQLLLAEERIRLANLETKDHWLKNSHIRNLCECPEWLAVIEELRRDIREKGEQVAGTLPDNQIPRQLVDFVHEYPVPYIIG